jgi:hypothetical protein
MSKMSELKETIQLKNYPFVELRNLEDWTNQSFDWMAELHAVPYDTIVRWTVGCSSNTLYPESFFDNSSFIDAVFYLLGFANGDIVLIQL